jgi:hypothetical protein
MYCILVRSQHEMSTCYFSCSSGPGEDPRKHAETCYAELVILNPVGFMGDVACSSASRS